MLDVAIILAFVGWAIYSGIRSSRKASENLDEYFLAGKTLTGWQAGISMAATQFAADTPLLVTGLIAVGGIYRNWQLWIYALAFLMMGFIFSIRWRRAGVLTDAELTKIRYSGDWSVTLVRVLKSLYYGTLFNCVVLAMVLVAAMRIAEVFLPWHEWLPVGFYSSLTGIVEVTGLSLGKSMIGLDPVMATANNLMSILLILFFTFFYSATGGLRSVVSTDIVQFVLAMSGTLIYAGVILFKAGGISRMNDSIVEIYGAESAEQMLSFTPPLGEALTPFIAILAFQWFFQMNSDGTGYLAQRSMACRTDKDARLAAIVFAWFQVFLRSLIWLVIGVGLLVLYPFTPQDAGMEGFTALREQLFITGIDDHLGAIVGLRGLMLAGLLGALASTIDTHFNWGASYWSNDIYKHLVCHRLLKRDANNKELVLVARLANVLILILALIIMSQLGSIQKGWELSLLIGAGMGSVLVLRWLWERINLYSELAAMVASLIVAYLVLFVFEIKPYWIQLTLMAGASTLAAVGITFFSKPTELSVLKDFYTRVKPMGFWVNTAKACGEDPRGSFHGLVHGIKETLLTALSLFALLVGVGKLMFRPPGESLTWAFVSLAIGLALLPLWIKEVSKQKG